MSRLSHGGICCVQAGWVSLRFTRRVSTRLRPETRDPQRPYCHLSLRDSCGSSTWVSAGNINCYDNSLKPTLGHSTPIGVEVHGIVETTRKADIVTDAEARRHRPTACISCGRPARIQHVVARCSPCASFALTPQAAVLRGQLRAADIDFDAADIGSPRPASTPAHGRGPNQLQQPRPRRSAAVAPLNDCSPTSEPVLAAVRAVREVVRARERPPDYRPVDSDQHERRVRHRTTPI